MNKPRTILAALGLSTAVVVGAATAASATDATPPSGDPAPAQIAQRCAKVPTVLEKIDAATTRVEERIAKLTEAKAKADAEGKTKRSERISALITRLQNRLDNVAARKTKVTTWQAAHCAS